jgi:isopentenyl phosphate kinase
VKSLVKVLKIGGSILTDKSRPLAARQEEIKRVAEEVATACHDLILVHGAGSFGHIPASRYGLPESFSPRGLRETHASVARLNALVVEALAEAGANPMPLHPFSCLVLRDGRIAGFALEPLSMMLENGILPVLHGDVAMDATRRSGIVSGDQLVHYLARSTNAEMVAVGTNVDGVMLQGRTISEIGQRDLAALEGAVGESSEVDVTGGMKGKLMELLQLAEAGIESTIFNASQEGQIERALRGEVMGTRVRAR